MEVVMEAMRMAGLALGLQALSSVALGAGSCCGAAPPRPAIRGTVLRELWYLR